MRRSHIGITVNAVTIAFTVLISLILGKYLLLPAIRLTHGHENLIGFLLRLGAICICIQTLIFSAVFILYSICVKSRNTRKNTSGIQISKSYS